MPLPVALAVAGIIAYERKRRSSMDYIANKIFDEAMDYLSERTDPSNMAAVTRLLNEALDNYEDGELTQRKADALYRKILPLVRAEHREELAQLRAANLRQISTYLPR